MVRRNTITFLLMKANMGKLNSSRVGYAAKEEGVNKKDLVKLLLKEAQGAEGSTIAINQLREIEKKMTRGKGKLKREKKIEIESIIKKVKPSESEQEKRREHVRMVLEAIRKKKKEKK